MKVFVHTRSDAKPDWINEGYNLQELPAVGEYLALGTPQEWYEVALVVHIPPPNEYPAEIYAIQVDHHKVLSKISKRPPPPKPRIV